MDDADLERQLAAYLAYRSRGGPQDFTAWMRGKDFAQEDRAVLQDMYVRAVTEIQEAS